VNGHEPAVFELNGFQEDVFEIEPMVLIHSLHHFRVE
jgi:hypothetical protein